MHLPGGAENEDGGRDTGGHGSLRDIVAHHRHAVGHLFGSADGFVNRVVPRNFREADELRQVEKPRDLRFPRVPRGHGQFHADSRAHPLPG